MGRTPNNLFSKLASVKEKLLPATQGLDDKQIQRIICHCWYYKLGRRKIISEKEREVYDLLLSHGISSKTVYEWLRIADSPDHIKQKISQGTIGMREASSKKYLWNRMVNRRNGKEIMEQVKVIVGGLEWKDTNQTL
ncbi:MAG: hypothetical protein AABW88_01675 [Nanoarchaeota archaeon]